MTLGRFRRSPRALPRSRRVIRHHKIKNRRDNADSQKFQRRVSNA